MSKLLQRLKNISGFAAPSVGFRPATPAPRHQAPVLIAVVAQTMAAAKEALDAGADAVAVGSCEEKAFVDLSGALSKASCGMDYRRKAVDVGAVRYKGLDFIVFSPDDAPASWLKIEGLAKIARVGTDVDLLSLRGLDRTSLDGFLLDEGEDTEFVSVRFLGTCLSIKASTDKPVLASVPSSVSPGDLSDLWNAGVDGYMVEAPAGTLRSIAKTIAALPQRAKRREGKAVPLLPGLGPPAAPEEDDEV